MPYSAWPSLLLPLVEMMRKMRLFLEQLHLAGTVTFDLARVVKLGIEPVQPGWRMRWFWLHPVVE